MSVFAVNNESRTKAFNKLFLSIETLLGILCIRTFSNLCSRKLEIKELSDGRIAVRITSESLITTLVWKSPVVVKSLPNVNDKTSSLNNLNNLTTFFGKRHDNRFF